MINNYDIDEALLSEAQTIGNFKTKKDTVNTALLEFIQRHKQLEITKLFGKVEYNTGYDYKYTRLK